MSFDRQMMDFLFASNVFCLTVIRNGCDALQKKFKQSACAFASRENESDAQQTNTLESIFRNIETLFRFYFYLTRFHFLFRSFFGEKLARVLVLWAHPIEKVETSIQFSICKTTSRGQSYLRIRYILHRNFIESKTNKSEIRFQVHS